MLEISFYISEKGVQHQNQFLYLLCCRNMFSEIGHVKMSCTSWWFLTSAQGRHFAQGPYGFVAPTVSFWKSLKKYYSDRWWHSNVHLVPWYFIASLAFKLHFDPPELKDQGNITPTEKWKPSLGEVNMYPPITAQWSAGKPCLPVFTWLLHVKVSERM